MKKSLGLWGLAAALSLCLTACGGGNARYDGDANSNGTVTNGDGALTGNDGVTDFGAARDNETTYDGGATYNNGTAYDGGATYSDGTAYDNGVTYDYRPDDRTMLEEASDAVESGVRRARDGLENAGDAIRDMNANHRTGS